MSSKWPVSWRTIVSIRRMPRTAAASACSGTTGRANRSRTTTISRRASLNQSSSIWCTTMNIVSSFVSGPSPVPLWSDSSRSTLMYSQ